MDEGGTFHGGKLYEGNCLGEHPGFFSLIPSFPLFFSPISVRFAFHFLSNTAMWPGSAVSIQWHLGQSPGCRRILDILNVLRAQEAHLMTANVVPFLLNKMWFFRIHTIKFCVATVLKFYFRNALCETSNTLPIYGLCIANHSRTGLFKAVI